MSRSLPPLNPLRTFEAAARHGSFTRAAEELLVSQSAVSRQIGVLESYLGLKLFTRDVGGIRLTPAGEQYFAEIGPAFRLLTSATARLYRSASGNPLKIKAYATFAAKWLMRRLPLFHALYPDINVRISTVVTPVDFTRDDVDAAIQLGHGSWSGAQAFYLFGDEITPVCAPALLEGRPQPWSLADLNGLRRLHSHYRRDDWPDWLRAAGAIANEEGEHMDFRSSLLTYQAAIDGLGVAMGQPLLLQEELDRGVLVRPFAYTLQRDLSYYLVLPQQLGPGAARLALFRDWLLTEAAR